MVSGQIQALSGKLGKEQMYTWPLMRTETHAGHKQSAKLLISSTFNRCQHKGGRGGWGGGGVLLMNSIFKIQSVVVIDEAL